MTYPALFPLPRFPLGRTTLARAICLMAALFLPAPVLAQADETPPTMEAVEQAWRAGDYVAVREGLKYLAEESGTPLAHYRYGRVLVEGRGGPKDLPGAVDWLQKAADQNHVEAMTLLARVYLSNLSNDQDQDSALKRDPQQAASLLNRAAALGDAEGQYYLALLYRNGSGVEADPSTAFNWFLASARQDYVESQYELSRAYSRGEGVEQNTEEALNWLTQAGENGHVRAQYFLATAYEAGTGVEQNPRQAARWYLRAAEAGLPIAQRNLGTLYLQGTGVEQNSAEGLRWLEAAATAGDASAMNNLGVAYEAGMGVEIDIAKAVDWYSRAEAHGMGRAMVALGRLHEAGTGVEQDMDQAITLYMQALDTADGTAAATRLGQLAAAGALDGKVAPHNAVPWAMAAIQAGDARAGTWLVTQAEAGVRPAISALATLYMADEDRAEEGVTWLDRAARAGDPSAQAWLGQLHMTGTFVELDYVAAHKWFNIAATLGQAEAIDLRESVTALMTSEQVAEAQAAARNWFENEEPQPPATKQNVQVTE